MKGKDRWDVLNDIKKEDPRLSAIIVTAFDSYRNDPRLLLADGYVIKSSDFYNLKQEIGEVLQRKEGRLFPPRKGGLRRNGKKEWKESEKPFFNANKGKFPKAKSPFYFSGAGGKGSLCRRGI